MCPQGHPHQPGPILYPILSWHFPMVLNAMAKNIINYLNRGAQGIDIVALGIDFVAVRAWAQSVCRLE